MNKTVMTFDFTALQPPRNPSTNVDAIDHQNGHLLVRFKGRPTVYSYADVPASVYEDLMASKSPGAFLRANVLGKFEHTKHDEPKVAAE